ncbi:MAG: GNAT family N-acetyltransferase [Dehalococcoidia bacterium]|nr:GNAT family N-acetyltransferase [Dehalococcoidia bacterium]
MERSQDVGDKPVIRTLSKDDVPAILEIDSKITGSPHSSIDSEKIHYYLRNPLVCWGAEVRGALVGFMLSDVRGWEFGASESGWIEIMGVDPAFQRRGLGRAMLNAILDELKKKGVKTVRVVARWYDPILTFFRTEGFQQGELLSVQKDLE